MSSIIRSVCTADSWVMRLIALRDLCISCPPAPREHLPGGTLGLWYAHDAVGSSSVPRSGGSKPGESPCEANYSGPAYGHPERFRSVPRRPPACKFPAPSALVPLSAESVTRLMALRRISETERISSNVTAPSLTLHPSSVGSLSFSATPRQCLLLRPPHPWYLPK